MKKLNKTLLVIFLLTIFWTFLIPGPRVASDFHYSYPDHLKSLFDFPFLWSTRWGGGLGHYVSSLWAWPFELIFGFLGVLGFSFTFIQRLLGVFLTIILGIWGINKLLKHYQISDYGRLAGTIFFLSNSYLILLIDGGQLNLAVAYSVLPLSFYFYRNFIDKPIIKNLILFTFSTLGISIVDLRIVVLLAFLIGLNILFDLITAQKSKDSWKLIKSNLWLGLFSTTFLILINLFWILPIILSRATAFIPANFSNLNQIDFLSFSNIGNGIFFQQPHWYKNNFGEIAKINADFLLLPLLILLAPILSKRDPRAGFWLLVSLVFIFLSKGVNEPFGQINSWLFEKIPVFILFRDPTKFFFLITISYAVLIGISIDEIAKRLRLPNYFKFLFPLLIIGYFLYLNKPVIMLQMNGMFSPPVFEKEYQSLNKEIELEPGFGRVVWINSKSPLGFESPDHPAVDAFSLLDRRPFAIGTKGTYEKLNFFREATFSGQLLDVTGITSIIYPDLDNRKDFSDDQIQYFTTFSNQLKKMPYVKIEDPESQILKLDLKQHQDRFFIPENFWWIIGDDKIYQESTKSANLNLSNNAMVFAEEAVGIGEKIQQFPSAKILLTNKTPLDFTSSFLNENEFISPAKYLKKDPDISGWWKRETADLIDWKDFLKTKYGIDNQDFDFGSGWSVAEGDLYLTITDKKILTGKMLLARTLESTRSGEISFYQEDLIGEINTLKAGDNIRWFEIGKLTSDEKISLKTTGSINLLNSLAIVEEDRWNNLKNLSKDILSKQQIESFTPPEIDIPTPSLTYSKINPTKFQIKIQGLEKPQLLVFSESFSPLWELNGRQPLPVYSMLNGFVVDKDGQYLIEFSPQKYVYPGLIISAAAFIILLLLLIKTRHD